MLPNYKLLFIPILTLHFVGGVKATIGRQKPDGLPSTITTADHIQGEYKKVIPPATFVDISAVLANFCTKFYITAKQ